MNNKHNQLMNFSQQEIQFLNNFSSIDDLYAFSNAVGDMVGKVEDLRINNPELFYSLAGGLSGAGIGAVGNLLIGDKKKSKLRRMLEGGLLGGGLAAGAGYLYGGKERAIGERNVAIDERNVVMGERDSLKDLTEEQKVALGIAGNRISELTDRTEKQKAENKGLKQRLHSTEYVKNVYGGLLDQSREDIKRRIKTINELKGEIEEYKKRNKVLEDNKNSIGGSLSNLGNNILNFLSGGPSAGEVSRNVSGFGGQQ